MSTENQIADVQARSIAGAFAVALGITAIAGLAIIERIVPAPDDGRTAAGHPPPPKARPKQSPPWVRNAGGAQTITIAMTEPADNWDLNRIQDPARRKEAFVLALLPLVLAENDRIRRQRTMAREEAPPDQLYERYSVTPGDHATLLRRIDIVPTSLALAQAAIESGWGTSRFVQAANNLFGERTYKRDAKGIAPREAEGFKITHFESLADSIRSYMHNLNSHPAYREFRTAREQLREKGENLTGLGLAGHLKSYSERRHHYVASVRQVIRENELEILDRARLALR